MTLACLDMRPVKHFLYRASRLDVTFSCACCAADNASSGGQGPVRCTCYERACVPCHLATTDRIMRCAQSGLDPSSKFSTECRPPPETLMQKHQTSRATPNPCLRLRKRPRTEAPRAAHAPRPLPQRALPHALSVVAQTLA